MKANDDFDVTAKIGPMFTNNSTPEWPMYSFDRPSWSFWRGFSRRLLALGYSEDRIEELLQHTNLRHYLDATDERIEALGSRMAIEYSKW